MSFQQGLSGLHAAAYNLDVIGNNIANANTVGAKSGRAEFAGLYASNMNGTANGRPGIGVTTGTQKQSFTQGSITSTGSPTDLAINGNGFFQVADAQNSVEYSRNGQFTVDKNGFMVNAQGLKLMGFPASLKGVIQPGVASPLQLPTAGIAPNATTASKLELNLDSRAKVTAGPLATVIPPAPALATVDIQDPATYNNATSTTVYDAKGQAVTVTYYFQKVANGDTTAAPPTGDQWNVYATANGVSMSGITPPEANTLLQPIATIDFPSGGGSPTGTTGDIIPYAAGVAGTAITTGILPSLAIPTVPLPTGGQSLPIAATTLDLSGLTEYGSSFAVSAATVDGNSPGSLTGVAIGPDGIVMANYSNGNQLAAGQVQLANFRNPNGLIPVGGNAWLASADSGQAIANVPGAANLGVLQAGAVEESNVDLTGELVNMMTAQRVYQANAQTIKTEDQILSTLVNLR